MSQKKTEGLLNKLQRLTGRLEEEKNHPNQQIPVLTDLAGQEESRQAIAVLDVKGDVKGDHQHSDRQEPQTLNVTGSELKSRLHKQAQLFIQEIIDEELVRIEAQLNRELNHYLNQLLKQTPEHSLD